MNKYVEEYIAKRKAEIEREEKSERMKMISMLQIGKREDQRDFPDENLENFPCYDYSTYSRFRYNAGEISDEDYNELLKYVPQNQDFNRKKMSGWYIFAIIMVIIGCIGSVLVGGETNSVTTGIISGLGVIIFFSQIILLCKIEYNTRSNS